MAFLNESLADSAKKYLVVQVYPDSISSVLHVQIYAPNADGRNRGYGFSFDLDVPSDKLEIIGWLIRNSEKERQNE